MSKKLLEVGLAFGEEKERKRILELIDNFNWFDEDAEWEDILGKFKRLISEGERI